MARRGRSGVTVRRNNFPHIRAQLRILAREAVEDAIQDLAAHMRLAMTQSGGGRAYVRGGRVHRASQPGQAPAVDEGILRDSLLKEMTGATAGAVYTNLLYGVYLEYGTAHVAARPYMVPAAEAIRPRFVAALRNLEARLR